MTSWENRNSCGIRRRENYTEGNDFMTAENTNTPLKAPCPSATCSPVFFKLEESTALSDDAMRNYDPGAPENAEREKIRSAQMRSLSLEEIEDRQRKNAHLMVNAYSTVNAIVVAPPTQDPNEEIK
jgi:hypothetical protein